MPVMGGEPMQHLTLNRGGAHGAQRVMDIPREQRAQGVKTARNIAGQLWWSAQSAAEHGNPGAAEWAMQRSNSMREQAAALEATL